jgi:hypothetical protein
MTASSLYNLYIITSDINLGFVLCLYELRNMPRLGVTYFEVSTDSERLF